MKSAPLDAGDDGTNRDLPWTVAMNGGALPERVGGTTSSVRPGALLVHPTLGSDTVLTFTAKEASTVQLSGTLRDLDVRTGDGATVTVMIRRANGTVSVLDRRTVGKGTTSGLYAEPIALQAGESILLVIGSGATDLCDTLEIDARLTRVRAPAPHTVAPFPIGKVMTELQGILGGRLLDAACVFNCPGKIGMNCSTEDIARYITNGQYDTMDSNIKSDYRFSIDRSKGRLWDAYVSIIQDCWKEVLLEKNGVQVVCNDGPIVFGGALAIDAGIIPNLPTRGQVRACLREHFDACYTGHYLPIVKDSLSVEERNQLQEQQKLQIEQAIAQQLTAQGLWHVQNAAPSTRTYSEQTSLDRLYASITGSPDRQGWTVADTLHWQQVVAAHDLQVAVENTTNSATVANITSTDAMQTRPSWGADIEWKTSEALGSITGTYAKNHTVHLPESTTGAITFHLDAPHYLNASMPSLRQGMTWTLFKNNEPLFQSIRQYGSAITMSAKLDAGDYRLAMTGGTRLGEYGAQNTQTLTLSLSVPLGSTVEGMISREGSSEVFPVRMSVAAFNSNGDRIYKDPQTNEPLVINPSLPTWVVVHGRESSEQVNAIIDLARSLADTAQVVMVDWNEAAKDFTYVGLDPLRDAKWTTSVGKWLGSQIDNLGFLHGNISFAGHSHGTYVSFFAAQTLQNLGDKVQTIVALDPARDPIFVGGFDESQINFSAVAKNSISLKASLDNAVIQQSAIEKLPYLGGTLSVTDLGGFIEFGDDNLARTAQHSYVVNVPANGDPFAAHSYPIGVFADIVRQRDVMTGSLKLSTMLSENNGVRMASAFFDGTILASGWIDQNDPKWNRATASLITMRTGQVIAVHPAELKQP
jgi:hypothetical protein